jgi:uncharacterized protein YjcR
MHGANKKGPGGGSRPGNRNAETLGFFSKHLPPETFEIVKDIMAKPPIEVLWDNIVIQYTAIIRAQHIMLVKDIDDDTTDKTMESGGMGGGAEAWHTQHSWDKQAQFLQSQSRAMATLTGMLKRYEEMCQAADVTEEQRLRIEKLKAEIVRLKSDGGNDTSSDSIEKYKEALQTTANEVWANAKNDS